MLTNLSIPQKKMSPLLPLPPIKNENAINHQNMNIAVSFLRKKYQPEPAVPSRKKGGDGRCQLYNKPTEVITKHNFNGANSFGLRVNFQNHIPLKWREPFQRQCYG
jgi:hypothetical protein